MPHEIMAHEMDVMMNLQANNLDFFFELNLYLSGGWMVSLQQTVITIVED